MYKVKLSSVEQYKITFLSTLQKAMKSFHILSCTITFVQDVSYRANQIFLNLKINDIKYDKKHYKNLKYYAMEEGYLSGSNQQKGIMGKKILNNHLHTQLMQSLIKFNSTQFLSQMLKEANFDSDIIQKASFHLEDSFFGLDFNDFDKNLVAKLENVALSSLLTEKPKAQRKTRKI